MKVVILCGGQGTRIRGVSEDVPKPMLPLGPMPIVWHIMKTYAHFGFHDFILCLGYKGDIIRDFFVNYQYQNQDVLVRLGNEPHIEIIGNEATEPWSVLLAETGQNSQTGSRLARVAKYIGKERFLLTYGDGVTSLDVRELITFHEKSGSAMTVTGVRPPGRFGEIEVNDHGMVSGFNEKPQATGGLISGGYFVCEPEVMNYISSSDDVVLEREPMQQLVTEQRLSVYRHDGFWQCMDTPRDWAYLNDLYSSGQAPWVRW